MACSSRMPALTAATNFCIGGASGFCDIASFTWLRRIWKHGIFGSEPTSGHPLLLHPAWHPFFDCDGADHARFTHRDEHRAAGMRRHIQLKVERTDLIRPATV